MPLGRWHFVPSSLHHFPRTAGGDERGGEGGSYSPPLSPCTVTVVNDVTAVACCLVRHRAVDALHNVSGLPGATRLIVLPSFPEPRGTSGSFIADAHDARGKTISLQGSVQSLR